MDESSNTTAHQPREALKFLERDFNQCFAQMRHYDAQIWDICKFAFTAYTALLGLSIGLYQYSIEKQLDLIPVALAALAVGVLLGSFILFLIIRNRVYRVLVTRYLNEHRQFFLRHKPLGFENVSQMYTDPSQPPFFNWLSTQTWLSGIVAGLNSTLLGALLVLALRGHPFQWLVALLAFVIFFAVQLTVAVRYLRSHESKTTTQAVFGKD